MIRTDREKSAELTDNSTDEDEGGQQRLQNGGGYSLSVSEMLSVAVNMPATSVSGRRESRVRMRMIRGRPFSVSQRASEYNTRADYSGHKGKHCHSVRKPRGSR